MDQNRNKLIELFIGNMSNAILHKILEKAITDTDIVDRYNKEIKNSFEIAKQYRDKINPLNISFPEKDINYIKNKIIRKVKAELQIRISKGYKNINLDIVEQIMNELLKETKITWLGQITNSSSY